MKRCTTEEAAAMMRPTDSIILGFGPAQPCAFLEALGKRGDWEDLTVFGGMLIQVYPVFTKPGVHLLSGFFGPAERALRDAGHDVSFLPGDFRRFKLFAERMAARVMALAATPPDADGWLSLSLAAGATVEETLRCGRDPERLLIVETSPRLPRTMGLPPEHRHAVHVDDVDVMIETDRQPMALPDPEPNEVERAIADHVRGFIPDGATLQTGIGGHEDFTSGASFEADDRSLICLPSTVEVDGEIRSRIHARFSSGTIVTTPRHQLDVVVTEYGAAEILGLTVRARAHALAEIAHPDFRSSLHQAADAIF